MAVTLFSTSFSQRTFLSNRLALFFFLAASNLMMWFVFIALNRGWHVQVLWSLCRKTHLGLPPSGRTRSQQSTQVPRLRHQPISSKGRIIVFHYRSFHFTFSGIRYLNELSFSREKRLISTVPDTKEVSTIWWTQPMLCDLTKGSALGRRHFASINTSSNQLRLFTLKCISHPFLCKTHAFFRLSSREWKFPGSLQENLREAVKREYEPERMDRRRKIFSSIRENEDERPRRNETKTFLEKVIEGEARSEMLKTEPDRTFKTVHQRGIQCNFYYLFSVCLLEFLQNSCYHHFFIRFLLDVLTILFLIRTNAFTNPPSFFMHLESHYIWYKQINLSKFPTLFPEDCILSFIINILIYSQSSSLGIAVFTI